MTKPMRRLAKIKALAEFKGRWENIELENKHLAEKQKEVYKRLREEEASQLALDFSKGLNKQYTGLESKRTLKELRSKYESNQIEIEALTLYKEITGKEWLNVGT